MAKKSNPRHGSLQFWPRKRASRLIPRVRSWNLPNEPTIPAFLGYKVNMCHVMVKDQTKTSLSKGDTIVVPATILECPPMRILGIRVYDFDEVNTLHPSQTYILSADKVISKIGFKPIAKDSITSSFNHIKSEILSKNSEKTTSPSSTEDSSDPKSYEKQVRVLFYSLPNRKASGQKKPYLFEAPISNNLELSLNFIEQFLDKDIHVADVFSKTPFVDARAVTKGKGIQGPVRRFGVTLRAKKSEKTKRGPGSLGAWNAQGHIMYRVAHAGQTGFSQRVDYNKLILSIGTNPKDINRKGGFHKFGEIAHDYVLVKGSVQGPAKRPVLLTLPMRVKKAVPSYQVKEIVV